MKTDASSMSTMGSVLMLLSFQNPYTPAGRLGWAMQAMAQAMFWVITMCEQ